MVSVNKEFHRLMRRVGKISDGQASIEDVEWCGELNQFTVVVRPNSGPYKGGTFKFQVNAADWPDSVYVICRTEIYHPNIDTSYSSEDTNLCLNVLDNSPQTLGFEGLVHGLIFLLKYPNLSDPLSPYFDSSTEDSFEENVRLYMAGEMVEGMDFETGFTVIDGVPIEMRPDKETGDNGNGQTDADSASRTTDTGDHKVTMNSDKAIQQHNDIEQRFNKPSVTAPQLHRSFSEPNVHTPHCTLDGLFARQASFINLPDSLTDEFKQLLDNYDYKDGDDDDGTREFVEIEDEIFLIPHELVDAFKCDPDSDTNNHPAAVDENNTMTDISTTGDDTTRAPAFLDIVMMAKETCVDTGCTETRQNEHFLSRDMSGKVTQRGTWTAVKSAFNKFVNLFTCSVKPYGRVREKW